MKFKLRISILFLCTLLLCACGDNQNENQNKNRQDNQWNLDKSAVANRSFAHEEELKIQVYVAHHKRYDFTKTKTGLRYCIYHNEDGPTAKPFQLVDVNYKIYKLDGTLLYHIDSNKVVTFKVNKDYVENGIMEGIQYMSEGDKARLIIPSRAAHGLLGDFNKIPPLTILVVDIKLDKIHSR